LALVVVNLAVSASRAHVTVAPDLHAGTQFDFDDQLTGTRYQRSREALERSGLYVRLEGGGAHLFLVAPSAAMID
jgi:hypothetical protein